MYVEAVAANGALTRVSTCFSHSLSVQLFENYGQVKVASSAGKPLPRVYIKVYARMNDGSVAFYKDGYTDIRGRFDYVSLSSDKLPNVQKFAILVLTEDAGALVREANKVATEISKHNTETEHCVSLA